MNEPETKLAGGQPSSARQAALADIAERRRKDPNWDPNRDPTYIGPHPTFVELMSDAEYERSMTCILERRRREASPASQAIEVRAYVAFGERVRRLRAALGWTQCTAAAHLGISKRSVIRYERGDTLSPRDISVLTLHQLELVHAAELTAYLSRV